MKENPLCMKNSMVNIPKENKERENFLKFIIKTFKEGEINLKKSLPDITQQETLDLSREFVDLNHLIERTQTNKLLCSNR
jgi:hypothetical protein